MKNKGFSLIELIVVISIFGIMIAIGTPSIIKYLSNSKIRSISTEIKESIEKAKLEAIKRNNTISIQLFGSNGNANKKNHIISLGNDEIYSTIAKSNESNIKLYKSVTVGLTTTNTELTTLNSASLSFSGNGRISGQTFDLLITGSGGSDSCDSDNACFKVQISSGGSIRMCNNNLQKSNHAQGC